MRRTRRALAACALAVGCLALMAHPALADYHGSTTGSGDYHGSTAGPDDYHGS